jgi:hypothetical protein
MMGRQAHRIQARALYSVVIVGRQLRQFGHVNEETTEVYLQWLVTACGITALASGWHEFLESGSED